MKKITIENYDEQTVIVARKIISMTDTVLTYEPKRLTRGTIAIDNSTKVTIEDCREMRDWCIVAEKGTKTIYALKEAQAVNGVHIVLQDLLTQEEAEELSGIIGDAITTYKFKE